MKSPKRDSLEREMIAKTAKTVGVTFNEVESVLDFYSRTISQNIRQDYPIDIHIDYIGKFKFQHKRAKIIEDEKKRRRAG